ncbi:MAG: DUF58 domain-containing protein [Euryarchaeota archaeon]|nr:DUF58 domain-containing protein [Euryarchaeota archaeon]
MSGVREVLKNIRRLEVATDRLVEGLISGNYRSAFRGRGIEFSEVREYRPGDDIRAIDWKVTARFNAPFVKEFVEERDLNVYIVFDVSGSTEFGSQRSKREVGTEVASIMFSALGNNDNVALALFTDSVERFIPPRKGRRHVLYLLRELIYFEPEGRGTDMENSLMYLNRIIKRRGIVFIITDCLSGDFERPLQILRKRHDVVLVHLLDAREEELPDVGYVLLEDSETGEQVVVDTGDRGFREAYKVQARKRRMALLEKMRRLKVDMVEVGTGEPFHVPLRRFFAARARRR